MAAHLDDMFSFCVEPGKVSASVEVRFIDNIKVFPPLTFSSDRAVVFAESRAAEKKKKAVKKKWHTGAWARVSREVDELHPDRQSV